MASSDAATAAAPLDSSSAPVAVRVPSPRERPDLPPDDETIAAYERLDKWRDCPSRPDAPARMVYRHNRSRAASTGFPTRLAVGTRSGLTPHETAAVFGWTTGDYRFVNPIARDGAAATVEFEDYPFLPGDASRVAFRLMRAEVTPYVRVLRSALSKLPPLPDQPRLWRGHRRRLTADEARPARVGDVITMPGFTGTARDRDSAVEFVAKSNEGRSSKRTLMCVLRHHSGRCISSLSARRQEGEVLFPPGARFEVVDPPGDAAGGDEEAVRRAVDRMTRDGNMPGAEIDLVYVREVDGRGNSMDAAQGAETGAQSGHCGSGEIGEWE